MPQENINSLEQAKWVLIPDDIKENRKDFNADNIREELYKRSAKIAEEITLFAERSPNDNLKEKMKEIAESRGLSRKQKEIFEAMVDIIEKNKKQTQKAIELAEDNLESFMKENKEQLEEIGFNDETEENATLGTMLFYAHTGKIPKRIVYLIKNPLLIELKVTNDDDMQSMHGSSSPSGFHSKAQTFKIAEHKIDVPTIVQKSGGYWTQAHEKNHHVFALLQEARKITQGTKEEDIDELINELYSWAARGNDGIRGVALHNIEMEGSTLESIKKYILGRARNEILTRHRSFESLSELGGKKVDIEQYLDYWGFDKLMKRVEGNKQALPYLETFKKSLIEEIRSTTKYTHELLTGMKLLQHEDREQALLALMETKDMEDWGDEINKVYKGDQEVYVKLGNIFNKLEPLEQDDPLWVEFKNIQKAFIFGVNEMQIPIKVVATQLEDKFTDLENKLSQNSQTI